MAIGLGLAAVACGQPSPPRAEVRAGWVRELVTSGAASAEEAECIAAAFFDPMDAATYRAFTRRKQLCSQEQAELDTILARCITRRP